MVGRRRGGGDDETEEEKQLRKNLDLKLEKPKDNAFNQDRIEKMGSYGDSSDEEEKPMGGRRRRTLRIPKGVHVKAKTLKRMLKSKGLKTTGKKSTLRSRARKAHLIRGGGK